jgi:hypothetical protein
MPPGEDEATEASPSLFKASEAVLALRTRLGAAEFSKSTGKN